MKHDCTAVPDLPRWRPQCSVVVEAHSVLVLVKVDDRGAKGPEDRGAKHRGGWGLARGREPPPQRRGSGGITPGKLLKSYMQICAFWQVNVNFRKFTF
jgi:hypothetical protein